MPRTPPRSSPPPARPGPPCTSAGSFTTLAIGAISPGFGVRGAFNVNRFVAFEAEMNHYLERGFGNGGTKIDWLLGVRVGQRWNRIGLFANLRPGVLWFSHFDGSDLRSFITDVGGVLEVYPGKRVMVRVDLGDTVVVHDGTTTNHMQTAVGFGYRF